MKALLTKAEAAYERGDYVEARRIWQSLSTEGVPAALAGMGALHFHGRGVPQDYALAKSFYERAGEHPKAVFSLGYMFEHGQGVPQNSSRAIELYDRAMGLGYDAAAQRAGDMYYHGRGVPQDYPAAMKWFAKAPHNPEALAFLAYMFEQGQGAARDVRKAVELYERAAAAGSNYAVCQLARLFYYGNGVTTNYRYAMELFQRAGDAGNGDAAYHIGLMNFRGDGIAVDYCKAVESFAKAEKTGHAEAQFFLGVCYARGAGVRRNHQGAFEWYRRAAGNGSVRAKLVLARAMQIGYHVAKSTPEARRLLVEVQNEVSGDVKVIKEHLLRLQREEEEAESRRRPLKVKS